MANPDLCLCGSVVPLHSTWLPRTLLVGVNVSYALYVELSPTPGYRPKAAGCGAMLCTFPPLSPSEGREATLSYCLYGVAVGLGQMNAGQGRSDKSSLDTWLWSDLHMGGRKASFLAQKADGVQCQALSALWVIEGPAEPLIVALAMAEHGDVDRGLSEQSFGIGGQLVPEQCERDDVQQDVMLHDEVDGWAEYKLKAGTKIEMILKRTRYAQTAL
ncbi:hypothetical protein EI94DRAFT_1700534 [Lactarius quietus]|nr:hypothetical protein EI94DRAFT_1700534 [Lactarius quietus]